MKLMIASDLHGSAFYCRQLLAAMEREQPDKLLLLGDILYHGPRNDLPEGYAPKEVIAMLNPLRERLLCVRGNCDTEVDQMVLAFLEHPEATLHMMGEECGGDEIFSHSLNVTVLCMMLAKGLELTPEQARTLGLGAMLHDIGLMDVPDRLLKLRPDEYTRPERYLRARHCEYGLRIGKQLGLPADILAIIFQHHEMVDGVPRRAGRQDARRL